MVGFKCICFKLLWLTFHTSSFDTVIFLAISVLLAHLLCSVGMRKDTESDLVLYGILAADKVAAASNLMLQVALPNKLKGVDILKCSTTSTIVE